jgi:hypothetical protein
VFHDIQNAFNFTVQHLSSSDAKEIKRKSSEALDRDEEARHWRERVMP